MAGLAWWEQALVVLLLALGAVGVAGKLLGWWR